MSDMIAVVKQGRSLSLARIPRPELAHLDDVRIRVAAAGICRTDLYVAEGRLPSRDPVVLGHEFSGVVDGVGAGVRGVRPGDRVTAIPWVACGRCEECHQPDPVPAPLRCPRGAMLGVDRDGAFA